MHAAKEEDAERPAWPHKFYHINVSFCVVCASGSAVRQDPDPFARCPPGRPTLRNQTRRCFGAKRSLGPLGACRTQKTQWLLPCDSPNRRPVPRLSASRGVWTSFKQRKFWATTTSGCAQPATRKLRPAKASSCGALPTSWCVTPCRLVLFWSVPFVAACGGCVTVSLLPSLLSVSSADHPPEAVYAIHVPSGGREGRHAGGVPDQRF